MVQPQWRTVWQFLTKLSKLLLYDPAIMFLGVYLKEVKACVRTKNLLMNVSSSFVHNCRNLEATKMYFRRWMDKSTVVHPVNRMLFRAKKNWVVKPWKVMEEPCMHITKWKDPIWKHYNAVWFQSGKVKWPVIARSYGERGVNRSWTENFGSENTPCDPPVMEKCSDTSIRPTL